MKFSASFAFLALSVIKLASANPLESHEEVVQVENLENGEQYYTTKIVYVDETETVTLPHKTNKAYATPRPQPAYTPSRPQKPKPFYGTTTITVHETVTLTAEIPGPTRPVFDDHLGCNHNSRHFQHHGHSTTPPQPGETVTVTAVGEAPNSTQKHPPNAAGVATTTVYTNIPEITAVAIKEPYTMTITERVVHVVRARRRHPGSRVVVVYKRTVQIIPDAGDFTIVLPPWYEKRKDSGYAWSFLTWTERLQYWITNQLKVVWKDLMKKARAEARDRAIDLAKQKAGLPGRVRVARPRPPPRRKAYRKELF
ncbi:hypothetical protein HGRIS_008866 [Hohenbuehelia grisea]|uniref:Uncharacterized protein n=1 Tax=Hohenbuehelia grisea TaxID=104357 RepID=A0ABR3IZF5_9AGAR